MSGKNWMEILGWDNEGIADLRYVAYSYIKQGIYDVALTFFDAIAALEEPSIYDLQTIGALHLQLGNGVKALDFLDKSLKLDPAHLQTQLNRVKALLLLGYKKQGLLQAEELEHCGDPEISSQAKALLLAYR
jgi:tetratricopeptide (TPR) repeat protein